MHDDLNDWLVVSQIQKYLEVEAVRLSQQSQEAAVKSESEKGEEANVEAKKRGGNSFGSILSPEMSAFVGESHMARTMVVKKLWEYIKGHNLQNPADRRKINLDSELSKLFKPPLTMLNMNKQLSRHCKVDDRGKLLHPRPGLAKRFTLTHMLHLLLLLDAMPTTSTISSSSSAREEGCE